MWHKRSLYCSLENSKQERKNFVKKIKFYLFIRVAILSVHDFTTAKNEMEINKFNLNFGDSCCESLMHVDLFEESVFTVSMGFSRLLGKLGCLSITVLDWFRVEAKEASTFWLSQAIFSGICCSVYSAILYFRGRELKIANSVSFNSSYPKMTRTSSIESRNLLNWHITSHPIPYFLLSINAINVICFYSS